MGRAEVLERLKSFPWRRYGVEYAILFGSAARGERFRDIDLAVKFKSYDLDSYSALLCDLASYLGVREDLIDLVPLNREDLPAILILEVYTKGVLVYCRDRDAFIDEALRRINVSYDFLIDARKLRLTEEAVKAVKRRWES